MLSGAWSSRTFGVSSSAMEVASRTELATRAPARFESVDRGTRLTFRLQVELAGLRRWFMGSMVSKTMESKGAVARPTEAGVGGLNADRAISSVIQAG